MKYMAWLSRNFHHSETCEGYNSFFCRGKVWGDRKIKRENFAMSPIFLAVKQIADWWKPEQILYSALAFFILLRIFLLFFFFIGKFPQKYLQLETWISKLSWFHLLSFTASKFALILYSSYLKLLFFVFIWFLHDICFSLAVLLQRAGKNGSSIKEWSPETKNIHATATSSEISGELLVFVLDFFFLSFLVSISFLDFGLKFWSILP